MSDFISNSTYKGKDTCFKCPKCQTETVIHSREKLLVFACPHCFKIYSKTNPEKYINLRNTSLGYNKHFPIGAKGEHDGKRYTVIGNVTKHNARNQYDKWEEIVLIDELGEISYLNCAFGHFTWLKQVYDVDYSKLIGPDEKKAVHQGRKYTFFMRYKYKTKYCRGEFTYDPVDVSKQECTDFISPPYLISVEQDEKGNKDIFFGKHFSRKQIAKIFDNPAIREMEKEGIGMAQPVLGGINVKQFILSMLVLVGLFIGISIITESSKSNRPFMNTIVKIQPDSEQEFVTNSFYLDSSSYSNYLTFFTRTPLSNEWVEVSMSLVNEKTGEEREFGVISEYYSGVDNGYSWSEGSDDGIGHISSVPGGKYHLKGKVYSSINSEKHVFIMGQYDTPTYWNLRFLIISLLVFCVGLYYVKRKYELMRTGEIDSFFDSPNAE